MFGNFGFAELLFIFVIALIFFGPRKLPELGKSLGQTLGQFKRASEDFKRSWEEEVEIEKRRPVETPKIVAAQDTVPSTVLATTPAAASAPESADAPARTDADVQQTA
jgi:TatA/E family protein of Tat protein translocase